MNQTEARQQPASPNPASTIPELRLLQYAFVATSCLWLGFWLASLVRGVTVAEFDREVIAFFRDSVDPERMIGPPALEEAMRDFTALGGHAILGTTVIAFTCILVLHPQVGSAWFFLLTCIPGYFVGMTLKNLVGRARPSIVPHLSHVGSSSFPSVHSMMAAITLVTIGLMLAQDVTDRRLKRLLVILPLGLTGLVGISRVCMGVHYPTDVLGGWTTGIVWIWAMFWLEQKWQGTKVPNTNRLQDERCN